MKQPGFGAPARPWRTFGFGIMMLVAAVGMYFYIGFLEETSASTNVPIIISWLYDLGGKELVSAFFAVLGLGAFGLGIAGVANRADDSVALRNAPPIAAAELTTHLMPALEFTPADLAANQRGQITPDQQAKLSKLSRSSGTWGLVSGIIILLMFVGIGSYVLYFAPSAAAMRASIASDPQTRAVLSGVGGFVALIVFGSLIMALLRARSVGKGTVRAVEGAVDLVAITLNLETHLIAKAISGQGRMCMIKIGGMKFHVTEAVLAAFKHQAPYRIYYVKNKPTHVLLSAEALSAA